MLLKDLAQPLPNPAQRQPGQPVGVHHRHSRAHSEAATTLALMVLDPMSVLTNAADEMSQSLSSKVQERSIRERRVSVGSGIEEMSRERLLSMLRQLQSGQGGEGSAADPAKLLELARRILKQPGAAGQMVREQGGTPRLNTSPCWRWPSSFKPVRRGLIRPPWGLRRCAKPLSN